MTSSDKERIDQAAKDRSNRNARERIEDPANYLLYEEDWFKAGAEYEHKYLESQSQELLHKASYNQAIRDVEMYVNETTRLSIQKLKK